MGVLMNPKPTILVTSDTGLQPRREVSFATLVLKQAYLDAIIEAGGIPMVVPSGIQQDLINHYLGLADGLVITGGHFDIDPGFYGAATADTRLDPLKPERTETEASLLRGAVSRHLPVLGICGGMQLINVVFGGTLHQDILAECPSALEHEQPNPPTEPGHLVRVSADSVFAKYAAPDGTVGVNSTHHQAVQRLAPDFKVWARSPDGVIEGFVGPNTEEIVGVQWHPELLDDPLGKALYRQLVNRAREVMDGKNQGHV
jgi:putative glutamine amidotransferase